MALCYFVRQKPANIHKSNVIEIVGFGLILDETAKLYTQNRRLLIFCVLCWQFWFRNYILYRIQCDRCCVSFDAHIIMEQCVTIDFAKAEHEIAF